MNYRITSNAYNFPEPHPSQGCIIFPNRCERLVNSRNFMLRCVSTEQPVARFNYRPIQPCFKQFIRFINLSVKDIIDKSYILSNGLFQSHFQAVSTSLLVNGLQSATFQQADFFHNRLEHLNAATHKH